MTGDAAAKLNLYLKVTRKRSDGFHELKTLFVSLEAPADRIVISDSADGFSFRSKGGDAPDSLDNLAARAALGYARLAGMEPSWHIELDKQIPVAAGMGGGSSDAGCVLRLLEEKYRKLGSEKSAALALELGADVPFFLAPRHAVAHGLGEKLSPLERALPPIPILLVNPAFPIRAAWAYTHLDPADIGADDPARLPRLLEALEAQDLERAGTLLHNDLAKPCFRKFPLLGELQDALLCLGAPAAGMTGSGSTLFALGRNRGELLEIEQKMRERFAEAPLWYAITRLAGDCAC